MPSDACGAIENKVDEHTLKKMLWQSKYRLRIGVWSHRPKELLTLTPNCYNLTYLDFVEVLRVLLNRIRGRLL